MDPLQIRQTELDLLQSFIEMVRSAIGDMIFLSFSSIDSFNFSAIIIITAWGFIGEKIGWRLFFILSLSWSFNIWLKDLFASPRPCHLLHDMGLFCPKSYGFPSGTAQFTFLLALIFVKETKKKWVHIVLFLFAIFSCFSRIYLGVHFFTDILAGISTAVFIALFYWKYLPLFENSKIIRSIVFILPTLLFLGTHSWNIIGIFIGIELGMYFNKKNSIDLTTIQKTITFLIGGTGLYILSDLVNRSFLYDILLYPGMGIWVSYAANKLTSIFFRKIL